MLQEMKELSIRIFLTKYKKKSSTTNKYISKLSSKIKYLLIKREINPKVIKEINHLLILLIKQ